MQSYDKHEEICDNTSLNWNVQYYCEKETRKLLINEHLSLIQSAMDFYFQVKSKRNWLEA